MELSNGGRGYGAHWEIGGARMRGARKTVWMTIMGAPQSGQMNGEVAEAIGTSTLGDSGSATGFSAVSSSRALAMLSRRSAFAISP
jgi:hypothetical protein